MQILLAEGREQGEVLIRVKLNTHAFQVRSGHKEQRSPDVTRRTRVLSFLMVSKYGAVGPR